MSPNAYPSPYRITHSPALHPLPSPFLPLLCKGPWSLKAPGSILTFIALKVQRRDNYRYLLTFPMRVVHEEGVVSFFCFPDLLCDLFIINMKMSTE